MIRRLTCQKGLRKATHYHSRTVVVPFDFISQISVIQFTIESNAKHIYFVVK